MKDYEFLGYSNTDRFCLDGVELFEYKWITLGECDIVLEPETKKPYSFSVYRIEANHKTIDFLAGKFSNDKWGFYRERKNDDQF